MANVGIDYSLHDTYYVVAHWHFVIQVCGVLTGFIAAYWVLAANRVAYRYWLGIAHFGATAAGLVLLLAPQVLLAFQGMPRRYVDYPDVFRQMNAVSSAGYLVCLAGLAVFAALVGEVAVRAWLTRRSTRGPGGGA